MSRVVCRIPQGARSRMGRYAPALLASLVLACQGDKSSAPPPVTPPPPPPVVVGAVTLAPEGQVLSVGGTLQLSVTVVSVSGAAVTGRTVEWVSDDTSVVVVSAAGLLAARTPGQATVTATVDGVRGAVRVGVTSVQPSPCRGCLEIQPSAALLSSVGATQRFVAFQVDSLGRRQLVAATFESTDPASVAITPAGVATAMAASGASRVVARVGAERSPPAIVVLARPVAGAIPIRDDRIVSPPEPVDTSVPYAPGYRSRVTLRGPAPAPGELLLGVEGIPVGGRVARVTTTAQGSVVELVHVRMDQLVTGVSLNERFAVDPALGRALPGVEDDFFVDRRPDGAWTYRSRPGRLPREVMVTPGRAASGQSAANPVTFTIGRLSCKGEVENGLTFPVQVSSINLTLRPSLTTTLVVVGGAVQQVSADGSLQATARADLVLSATVKGELECKTELHQIVLPLGGFLALFIGAQLPMGVGFELEADLQLPGFGTSVQADVSATARIGVQCTSACQVFGDITPTATASFTPVVPQTLTQARLEVAASAFAYLDLQVGNPFLQAAQLDLVEGKLGVRQKAELATELGQALDTTYASAFTLEPFVEVATTDDLNDIISHFNIPIPPLSLAPPLPDIAHSPTGTLSISPANVTAGDSVTLGQQARFTVQLTDVNYLGAYAVDEVHIRWLRRDSTGATVLDPGRPGCTTMSASPGQTNFTCQTDFTTAHRGPQRFVAFVKARLYGVPLPVLLEVGPNGGATVTVDGGEIDGNVVVRSQRELAALSGISRITGGLVISSGSVPSDPITSTDLRELSSLREVGGGISVLSVPSLRTLDGLGALRVLGGFIARQLPQLGDIRGLAGVSGALTTLELAGLPVLTSLSGLEGVTGIVRLTLSDLPLVSSSTGLASAVVSRSVSIGATGITSLAGMAPVAAALQTVTVIGNPALLDLAALSSLRTVDNLNVNSNAVLPSVAALGGVTSVRLDVSVSGRALGTAGLPGLVQAGRVILFVGEFRTAVTYPALRTAEVLIQNDDLQGGTCRSGASSFAFPRWTTGRLTVAGDLPPFQSTCRFSLSAPVLQNLGGINITGAGLMDLALGGVVQSGTACPVSIVFSTVRTIAFSSFACSSFGAGNNPALRSITLGGVSTADITIYDNPALTTLSGGGVIVVPHGQIAITGNTALATAAAQAFAGAFTGGRMPRTIIGNAP